MVYLLWDLRATNVIRDLDTEHDALAATLRLIDPNRQDSTDHLSLTVDDEAGEGDLIAYGPDLAEHDRHQSAAKRTPEPDCLCTG